MNNDINDIFEDLESNLDLKNIYELNKIDAKKLNKDNTADILKDLDKLDVRKRKYPAVKKLKTKNFDS
jgi:hypothetical protein